MIDGVLEVALLALEGKLHGIEVVVLLGSGHLSLNTRLEALLGLRHELVADGLPRVVVGGRRGDRHVGKVADLDLRGERAEREPTHVATGEA